jgi:two-component system, cell cycle sensor histidine kinase and response regulator CckA
MSDPDSDRLRHAATLEASEKRYRRLFESAKDGILILDADTGEVVDVNPFLLQLLGFSYQEMVGQRLWEIGVFKDVAASKEAFRTLQEKEYVRYDNLPLEAADGRVIAVEFVSNVYPVDGRKVIQCNIRDISARKKVEDALARSELYYRSLIEHGVDIIAVLSPGGVLQYVSPAVERILGYEARELEDRDVFGLIHPEDQGVARERLRRALEPGQTWERAELRLRHRDGSWRTIAAIGNSLPPEIGLGVIVNARDLTEHQHLESQMRQAQKMEAVGRLAGGIAHDFNNLLTVILGYAQMLADRVPSSPDLAEDVAEILRAGERAASLTRQLLTFSRHRPTEQKVVSPESIVADTERMIRRLVGEDIVVTARSGTAALVRVDPGQIEQVLVNLAVNARDAMPSGGQLTIETSRVELDETYGTTHLDVKPGPYLLLAVTDTGTGMDAATLGHLFEPFFTTKEKGKGTGLGLSTVYGIVKQSGGHIEAYSETGLGTTFKVYLPIVEDGAVDRSGSRAVPRQDRGSETVLVVEDEEAVRTLVRRELESRGYAVLAPAGADEALLLCERHAGPIHLLMTDIVMPGMLGPEVARRAAALRPELKVLYMSGYTDESIMKRGTLRGDEPFLQKPFTPNALAQKVREALDGPAGAVGEE